MAQRTLAAGFTDTGIEKAAAKSASAGKNKICVNQRNPRLIISSCLRDKKDSLRSQRSLR
jgi:hypothetical protein